MTESTSSSARTPEELVNDATNPLQRAVDRLLERILTVADVRRVFGEPVVQGDRTVIPVAQVRTMMGFGGGSGTEPSKGNGEAGPRGGEGGGGGGGVKVMPLGYIEVTPEWTRFVPIVDRSRLVVTAIIAFTLLMLVRRPRSKT
jgi:uncharacterized spore protein YtfJ